MKEFMFFIRKKSNSQETLDSDKFVLFLKACESYIGDLKNKGKLISAQPMAWSGKIISGNNKNWKVSAYEETGEVIAGYYHILAKDFDEAVKIAKDNPEFAYNQDTRIEVRPVKIKEEKTGFVYPDKQHERN